MKESPIIFTGEMVRAILDGCKTQTRRIVKLDDRHDMERRNNGVGPWWPVWYETGAKLNCPYGQPGDRLWVRESHLLDPPQDGTWDYYAYTDGVLENLAAIPERFRHPEYVMYRADISRICDYRWRPSIHMPRWASRITLEVTSIWVERLQEISEADAIAEGVDPDGPVGNYRVAHKMGAARYQYANLWDSIHGKDRAKAIRGEAHPWESNPWVWVVEFKRV